MGKHKQYEVVANAIALRVVALEPPWLRWCCCYFFFFFCCFCSHKISIYEHFSHFICIIIFYSGFLLVTFAEKLRYIRTQYTEKPPLYNNLYMDTIHTNISALCLFGAYVTLCLLTPLPPLLLLCPVTKLT